MCADVGHLFNIQRFSLDDGPGIRSIVFLKGCNQRCAWCHNPESLGSSPQLMRKHSLCTGCGACIAACPKGANVRTAQEISTKEELCDGCGVCVNVCPVRALKVMGFSSTVEETMAVVRKDKPFYDKSGGGVTFSGGEPTCQSSYLLRMLDECGREGIHRAIETNGNTPMELVREVSARTEYVMIDLKHTDDRKHRAFTGAGNKRTLEALRYYRAHNETEIRIPLIPGFNDSPEELSEMFDFLKGVGAERVTVLPYHTFGISKYESLSMEYSLPAREAISAAQAQALLNRADTKGLEILIH